MSIDIYTLVIAASTKNDVIQGPGKKGKNDVTQRVGWILTAPEAIFLVMCDLSMNEL